jgi:hypothetical protein
MNLLLKYEASPLCVKANTLNLSIYIKRGVLFPYFCLYNGNMSSYGLKNGGNQLERENETYHDHAYFWKHRGICKKY